MHLQRSESLITDLQMLGLFLRVLGYTMLDYYRRLSPGDFPWPGRQRRLPANR